MKKNKLAWMMMAAALVMPFAAGIAYAADDAEAIAAKRAELNDHEWQVKVMAAANKENVTEDTLIFKDQMFESKSAIEKGYKPTNYTVSLQEGGPTVWETMQSIENDKVVFWRGEWEGESMRGVMSKQVGEGKSEDYYFSSISSKAIEKAPEPVKEEAAPEAADAVPAPEAVQAAASEAAAPAVEAAAAPVEEVKEAVQAQVEEVKQETPKKKKKWGF